MKLKAIEQDNPRQHPILGPIMEAFSSGSIKDARDALVNALNTCNKLIDQESVPDASEQAHQPTVNSSALKRLVEDSELKDDLKRLVKRLFSNPNLHLDKINVIHKILTFKKFGANHTKALRALLDKEDLSSEGVSFVQKLASADVVKAAAAASVLDAPIFSEHHGAISQELMTIEELSEEQVGMIKHALHFPAESEEKYILAKLVLATRGVESETFHHWKKMIVSD